MSTFQILMPKLGESVQEATITKWFIKEGDTIEEEDVLLEIATDKVDSEIPSPVDGLVTKVLYKENDVVPVGEVIAIVSLDGEVPVDEIDESDSDNKTSSPEDEKQDNTTNSAIGKSTSGKFYSPLVKSIAAKEGVSIEQLDTISGTGHEGRVTKTDILNYLKERTSVPSQERSDKASASTSQPAAVSASLSAGDEIIEMDRMRKIIAENMVKSKQISAHVTNMLEVDVTNMVIWRKNNKESFQAREKEKITYLPLFLDSVVKAIKDFPMINSSVSGNNIIIKKDINLGIAVALPTGNLIVPVIKNAENLNIVGLTKNLNSIAEKARNNKLSPDDISGGTFSISNFGSFKNLMGTPILPQPQSAILAIGSIEKKPAVIETPQGDTIGIRHKMFLSLTYDHRIIDGALGGGFLRRVADYMEAFDPNAVI